MELARAAANTGEPIVKYLDYVFPNQDLATVNDQFLLGDNIMGAPMLESRNKIILSLLSINIDQSTILKSSTIK